MLIEHHIKYKEIHGVDETVWMEKSEHVKLHNRLRKEGKCSIPTCELDVISRKAHQRSNKYRTYKKEYDQQRPNRNKYVGFIEFLESVCTNVRLRERINYWKDGDVCIVSGFIGNNNTKIPIIIIS